MEKAKQLGSLLQGNGNFWNWIFRQIFYGAIGAIAYFIFSWLFAFIQPSIGNITFRSATVILVLFGVYYGPWVGLFSGLVGKTLVDVFSGWSFNWYGSVACGLIGFVSGFMHLLQKENPRSQNIWRAILWGGLGVLISAVFLLVVELFLSDLDLKIAFLQYLQPGLAGNAASDISLKVAFLDFFLPEFVGNLTVVIILLPLLLIAVKSLARRK